MILELRKSLLGAILDADRESANRLVDEWAFDHGYKDAVSEILEPVLEKIGDMWNSSGDLSIAQGYVAGKIAEDILTKAINKNTSAKKNEGLKGPVVIGNIEDDCHSLGRKMVASSLRVSGWKVYDLGNDVLSSDFVDKACEVKAPIIGVSAMMYSTAVNIRKVREEIDRRGLNGKIHLAVGGAIFLQRKDLVEEVGGNGTAKNAFKVPILMENLIKKVKGGIIYE